MTYWQDLSPKARAKYNERAKQKYHDRIAAMSPQQLEEHQRQRKAYDKARYRGDKRQHEESIKTRRARAIGLLVAFEAALADADLSPRQELADLLAAHQARGAFNLLTVSMSREPDTGKWGWDDSVELLYPVAKMIVTRHHEQHRRPDRKGPGTYGAPRQVDEVGVPSEQPISPFDSPEPKVGE